MMMEYMLVLYKKFNNGNDPKYAIYVKTTKQEAVAQFHTLVGASLADSTVAGHCITVIDCMTGKTIETNAHENPVYPEETTEEGATE